MFWEEQLNAAFALTFSDLTQYRQYDTLPGQTGVEEVFDIECHYFHSRLRVSKAERTAR